MSPSLSSAFEPAIRRPLPQALGVQGDMRQKGSCILGTYRVVGEITTVEQINYKLRKSDVEVHAGKSTDNKKERPKGGQRNSFW